MSHRALAEIVADFERALPLEHADRYRALQPLRAECPCFAPALFHLFRAAMLSKDEVASASEVRTLCDEYVAATNRNSHALEELGAHLHVMENQNQQAVAVFDEAIAQHRRRYVSLLALRVEALAELEQHERARREIDVTLAMFPGEQRLKDAEAMVEFERR